MRRLPTEISASPPIGFPTFAAYGRSVLEREGDCLRVAGDRLGESFDQAVMHLLNTAGDIIVTGMGKAGLIAQKIAATMASTGTRAFYLHPAEAVHGDLGRVRSIDTILAFSHSGETSELLQLIGPVREQECSLVAVTSRASSSLGRSAQVVIEYGAIEEICPIKMAPSSSCSVMLAIGDALAFSLMQVRGFDGKAFGRFHPAGALGRRLGAVELVMRRLDDVRVARSDLSVSEVFVQAKLPGRRTGAVMLVDEAGKLEGLFTDSDLARLVERRDFAAFDHPVSKYMTRRPKTVRLGQKTQDALTLLQQFRLSELPVLDFDDRPMGLIDITDLMDLLPDPS